MKTTKHLTPKEGTLQEKKAKLTAYMESKGYKVKQVVIEGTVSKVSVINIFFQS